MILINYFCWLNALVSSAVLGSFTSSLPRTLLLARLILLIIS